MKPTYTRDNTRSSLIVLCALALVVLFIAMLIGVSDKPEVNSIALVTEDVAPGSAPAPGPDASPDLGDEDLGNLGGSGESDDTTGETAVDGNEQEPVVGDPAVQDAEPAQPDVNLAPAPQPTREIILVPTAEPSPTPEVAAAVEPAEQADADTEVQAAPALPTTSGTVQGEFFTKSDENDGARVDQNLVTVSFAEDGSGAFQGVLDITYPDGRHILLNMSGPIEWLPANPQVSTTLEGAFTLDAPIAADSIRMDDAELSITSLSAGTGSLCTSRCFGFTFPPQ